MAQQVGVVTLMDFDGLQDRLFDGTLHFKGAVKLWQYYMIWPKMCTLRVLLCVLAVHFGCRILGMVIFLFPAPWFALVMLGINIGYVQKMVNLAFFAGFAPMLMSLGEEGVWGAGMMGAMFLACAVKNATGLFGLKGVMVLACGNFIVFGVMVAWLIRMGVRKKMF
jgi:hypothetical protein